MEQSFRELYWRKLSQYSNVVWQKVTLQICERFAKGISGYQGI
jgi:hypothetical protein